MRAMAMRILVLRKMRVRRRIASTTDIIITEEEQRRRREEILGTRAQKKHFIMHQ